MSDKLRVMLTTEGTYPFHQGGVSTWCDILVHNLKEVDYVVYSVIMNPYVTQKFTLPEEAALIKVPLWGTEEPSEHLTTPFSQVYMSKKRTTDKVVRDKFIPLFTELIDELLSVEKNSCRLGMTLVELYKYFQEYEYKKSFKSQLTWNAYKEKALEFASKAENKLENPSVNSLIQSMGWIYRFLNILNTPLPKVHVTHSAAAAFCGIPCVVAKIKDGTPYMLTEHGVYLREQYLSLVQRKYSSYLSTFLIRMIHSVVNLNYAYADQVSPVCDYNTRWERKFGVKPENIRVIYNGVDKNVFSPLTSQGKNSYPTVVTIARVDPVKDMLTLLRAAAIVKAKIPEVRFIVYGSVSVPSYYDECLALKNELNLGENFVFAGHTSDMPAAYRSGDVVVLSSISEAFPYSVVEAMMCGKPVVATDVGGIKEALGDTGIVVSPRQPQELADAVTNLLGDAGLRTTLGEEARQRALNYFTIGKVLEHHLKSYITLGVKVNKARSTVGSTRKQKLYLERGLALMGLGFYNEAAAQFTNAANAAPNSPGVPAILALKADIYSMMGQKEKASGEIEKAELLEKINNARYSA